MPPTRATAALLPVRYSWLPRVRIDWCAAKTQVERK